MTDVLNQKLHNEDVAKLLLRVCVGVLMLFHGIAKISGGVGFLEGMFSSMGLPAFFAYGVYLGEVLAPIMLIVGYQVRIASILVAGTIVVAILMAHMGDIFMLTEHGVWAIELQMFYILACAAILFQGAGKYSIDKK